VTAQALADRLLALADAAARQRFLSEHAPLLDEGVAEALKAQADRLLRSDIDASLQTASLMHNLAGVTGNPLHQALALLAEANARSIGLGQYQAAVQLYDQAAEIYRVQGQVVRQARSQIGKLFSLASLGRYPDALAAGEWASQVLEADGQWRLLADVTLNMGVIHGRLGQDREALALFDRACDICLRLGAEAEPSQALIEQSRSIVLRNLGRFEESMAASHRAWQMLDHLGQAVEASRARQNLAVTYLVLGRYNEALEILDQAREAFVADGRHRDALLLDLFVGDCLLELRRFSDVLARSAEIRQQFSTIGAQLEVGQALLNEALAFSGLHCPERARDSLAEARRLFDQEGNQAWVATADLQLATLLLQAGQAAESLATAERCAATFGDGSLPLKEAQARLIAARALLALQALDRVPDLLAPVLALAAAQEIPALAYQGHHLLGRLHLAEGNVPGALRAYRTAIRELERLRGRLMVEFRAGFVEDKQAIYEEMVRLCLDVGQPVEALDYVERSKSRALIDLLAHRVDLSIHTRKPEDRPLVDELARLQAERDRLHRRWEGHERSTEEDWATSEESRQFARAELLALEGQITALWERLLVRDAGYAREASLWQVHTEPVQEHLPPATALLEYYRLGEELVAFLVSAGEVRVQPLPAALPEGQRLLQLLWLNLRAVPRSPLDQAAALQANAQGLLRRLHNLLLAPLADWLAPYPNLIVVPHGPLHYLPFHALHDGQTYLLERQTVSYLPAASLLRFCDSSGGAGSKILALGHSHGGRYPHTLEEARAVASSLGELACVEERATVACLRERASGCRVIHLAAHGLFRADNPLFSGLALADGWLTTLEICNLQLPASLVTLSACQTGQNVVAGGDELLGLMRALFAAGAASAVLSLWAVEDRSTARLMAAFYRGLSRGETKAAALRAAQLELANEATASDSAAGRALAHPYFWAPFFLVGAPGKLWPGARVRRAARATGSFLGSSGLLM
jgi:CHAT domain-containing protein